MYNYVAFCFFWKQELCCNVYLNISQKKCFMSLEINHTSIISMFLTVHFNRQRSNREGKMNLKSLDLEEKGEDVERGKGLRIKA